ncbi:putative Thyrotropin-releasing hormone receptor [Hypsibius exemplaris]|uniref:Thyrotropin-releasing hormone receptor n=1 Tax=Hypsibius exemplaris TaxID=2072580 RepID=A0A1W0WXY5_HYPEX|nr:putative Thyrotropin-releasing hormone receptor [Hypsibius exemplaris]
MENNNTTGRANASLEEIQFPPVWPLDFRITATVLHSIILLLGVVGNVLVVIVVYRKKSMHVPTYCYLVSLAIADVLVVVSSMPEAIVSYQLHAGQWVLGQAGCSLMAFSSFLGINSSSLSILAFTVERYIAICHPLLAKRVCNLQRAKKIILCLWTVAFVSAVPWLGLTVTKQFRNNPDIQVCSFRLTPDTYHIYPTLFGIDIIVFYAIPLILATVLYTKIGLTLRQSSRSGSVYAKSIRRHTGGGGGGGSIRSRQPSVRVRNGSQMENKAATEKERRVSVSLGGGGGDYSSLPGTSQAENEPGKASAGPSLRQSRIKVIRMLLVIVILFAILWLPYRGISLYNGFAAKPFYNKWAMFFAKTCIFLNSSVNPILYNAMSKRFRQAFRDILLGERSDKSSNSTTDGVCQSSRSLLINNGGSPCPSPSYSRGENVWSNGVSKSIPNNGSFRHPPAQNRDKDYVHRLNNGHSVAFLDPSDITANGDAVSVKCATAVVITINNGGQACSHLRHSH